MSGRRSVNALGFLLFCRSAAHSGLLPFYHYHLSSILHSQYTELLVITYIITDDGEEEGEATGEGKKKRKRNRKKGGGKIAVI